ncbi:MAG: hypothetical protein ABR507_10545 [Actinomycetota bacterium]|nr:hypothetical protein [Actinomycetota bacterium]
MTVLMGSAASAKDILVTDGDPTDPHYYDFAGCGQEPRPSPYDVYVATFRIDVGREFCHNYDGAFTWEVTQTKTDVDSGIQASTTFRGLCGSTCNSVYFSTPHPLYEQAYYNFNWHFQDTRSAWWYSVQGISEQDCGSVYVYANCGSWYTEVTVPDPPS